MSPRRKCINYKHRIPSHPTYTTHHPITIPHSRQHSDMIYPSLWIQETFQTYRYNVGSSTNNNNNNISSNSNSADNNTGSTGLEAPEPLASLPVLPPTLPLPGGSSSIGKRHSSTGVHPSDSSGSNESHGSSFPLSFQPPPSSPVSYQGHDTGLATGGNKGAGGGVNDANGGSNSHNTNNTSNAPFQGPYSNPASLDMLSGLQGTRKQQPIYQQITHHPQPQQHQYQQQQLPFRQASSSYSMTPLSASLPVPSGFQYYGQQQQSSKQQQQEPFYRPLQHHYPSDPSLNRTQQPTSPSTPFPRDTLARSRSQSLTVLTTTTAPISVPSAQGVSTGAPPASYATTLVNTATTTVTGESIDNSSQSKKVVIPRRPRILPPRPPQLTAPRKYHGRQMRKPSIHHHPIPSDLLELVSPSRRVAHIASEQKRREKINSGFEELKSVIPECAQNTDSKASILRKAVDRILELEDELRRYTDPPQQQQHEGEEEPEREE
ncbi:hypothetical protein B0O80DRAFT_162618 [Mortierella sp. GBAus27b]|nr:hypothetical protein B0O80DRAFT_162618 [Mortierella sp. GBAus27b]